MSEKAEEEWEDRIFIARTSRVGLCVLTREDVPMIWRLMMNHEVNRFLNTRWNLRHIENEYEWYDELIKKTDERRGFGMILSGEKNVSGFIFLSNLDFRNRVAYLGALLAERHWKKGIMTEAVDLMKKYCFEELNLRKIVSNALEPNRGSVRVLEKTGFKNVGRLKAQTYVPGYGFVDELMFELFNETVENQSELRK